MTQAVTLPALLELMDSLAVLVRQGERPWHLDVVWEAHESPWYVAACRRRCAALGLDAHVRFLGPTSAGRPASTSAAERSVLLLEPMADRRRRRREQPVPGAGGAREVAVARYRSVLHATPRHRVDRTA